MECLLREVIEKGKNYEESVGTPSSSPEHVEYMGWEVKHCICRLNIVSL